MAQVVNFEVFRTASDKGSAYNNGAEKWLPNQYPVPMFKVLVLAAQNTVSDARMKFLIRAG